MPYGVLQTIAFHKNDTQPLWARSPDLFTFQLGGMVHETNEHTHAFVYL